MTITYEWVRDNEIFNDKGAQFKDLFPNGLEVNQSDFQKAAEADMTLYGICERIMTPESTKACNEASRPWWDDYCVAIKPLWDVWEARIKQKPPFWRNNEEYTADCINFWKARKPYLDAYNKKRADNFIEEWEKQEKNK
jgi:hypothetical protein